MARLRLGGIRHARFRLVVEGLTGALEQFDAGFRTVEDTSLEGTRRIVVDLDRGRTLNELLGPMLAAGVTIRSCDRLEPDLEDAFSRIVGEEKRG